MNIAAERARPKFVSSVEDLEVYRLAYRLALELHRASIAFPKMEQYELASQLRRASKGICANLAEGFAKQAQSSAEFGRFLAIAIGSANEIKTWLRFCEDLGYIEPQQASMYVDRYDKIARMLQKLRNR